MKIRTLTELRATAAREYQDAMLQRVEYFANQGESVFNNQLENLVVKGLSAALDLKLKIDEKLGPERLNKVHKFIEKILLTF